MIYIYMFLGITGISLGVIMYMLITLIKQGDERNEVIISKACKNTLLAMFGYLVICVIERAINTFNGINIKGVNPLIQLTILAIFYLIQLSYYKKKYGE